MPALGLALGLPFQISKVGASAPPAPVAGDPLTFVVRSDGWSADLTLKEMVVGGTYDFGLGPNNSPEDGNPKLVITVESPGFTTSGAAATIQRTIHGVHQMRKAYPNQADADESASGDDLVVRISLDEYIYTGDVITSVAILSGLLNDGVTESNAKVISGTNDSAAAHQPVIANWSLPDRIAVDGSIAVEVVTAHQHGASGSQVACVVFTATDGATTISSTVSTPTVSGRASDKHAVMVHSATLDVSTLDAGVITVNAVAYPWVGSAGLDSSAQSARREFSPRYFLKDPSRAGTPWRAYVDAAGNDGTGAWSQTDATAAAAPFATPQGAINGIAAQVGAGTSAAAGSADGCEVRVRAGTFTLVSAASARKQNVAAVIITRDPAVAKANAIVTFGAAAWRPSLGTTGLVSPVVEGGVIFRDITVSRTGTSTIQGEAGVKLNIVFDDVIFDNDLRNATMFQNSHGSVYGMTLIDSASSFALPGTYEWRIWRGVEGTIGASIEGWLILGCNLATVTSLARGTRTASGSIVAFNRFYSRTSANALFVWGADADVIGAAQLQNVVEYIGTTSAPAEAISADGGTGNLTNIVRLHNTYAGFDAYGRWNFAYNDTPAGARTHTHIRSAGNITVQINTKHDVFMTDGTRVQSWQYLNGVGCSGELSQFQSAGSGGFKQDFPGINTKIGTSSAVPIDPEFVDPKHTTSGPTGGAGNGDYRIGATSPARNLQRALLLKFDLAGTARAATDAAGAYAQ